MVLNISLRSILVSYTGKQCYTTCLVIYLIYRYKRHFILDFQTINITNIFYFWGEVNVLNKNVFDHIKY